MEEKKNRYDHLMNMLTEDLEMAHGAFAGAYASEGAAHRRLEVCRDYAQSISGIGMVLSTVSLLRPREDHTMMLGFGGKEKS